ncbi:hypothetical protein CsSME_00035966 [Camellia sinensis var. sinensis]
MSMLNIFSLRPISSALAATVTFVPRRIAGNVDGCSVGLEIEAWSGRGDEVVRGVIAEGGDLLFLRMLGTEGLCAGQLASPAAS